MDGVLLQSSSTSSTRVQVLIAPQPRLSLLHGMCRFTSKDIHGQVRVCLLYYSKLLLITPSISLTVRNISASVVTHLTANSGCRITYFGGRKSQCVESTKQPLLLIGSPLSPGPPTSRVPRPKVPKVPRPSVLSSPEIGPLKGRTNSVGCHSRRFGLSPLFAPIRAACATGRSAQHSSAARC